MTTRKELIKRIKEMQLGTQEMLDAAAYDARLIPFDTLFVDEEGDALWRTKEENRLDDAISVAFCSWHKGCVFHDGSRLHPMNEN